MGTKSKAGSPIWTGSFGHWNPHVIRRPLNKIERPTPFIAEFVEKHGKVCELLRAAPGTKTLFEAGIPLCPVLIPQLQSLKKDDITLDKVGGLPDPRRNWLCRGLTVKKINSNWPRCGTCHERMSFVAQVEIGDYWDAIHRLTCDTDSYGHFSYSSVGIGEDWLGSSFRRHDKVNWTFFMCANAQDHFYSQNFDAHIWIDRETVYDNEILKFLGEKAPTEEEIARSNAQAQEAIRAFYAETHVKKYGKAQQIKGFSLRFDLDFYSGIDYKIEARLEKIQKDNPDIFAYSHSREFKLFGEPESQQEEARYFGLGNRSPQPYRLAPVLCWDDNERDMTYQMYAELWRSDSEGRRNFPAKIDASCT